LSGRPSTARHVGPGTYGPGDSIVMSKSKSVAQDRGFGTSGQNKLKKKFTDPGPGHYSLGHQRTSVGSGFPMGNRSNLADEKNVPGPGSHLDPTFNAYKQKGSDGVTMKFRPKNSSIVGNNAKNPGPAHYSTAGDLSRQGKGTEMGKSQRS